MGLLKSLRLTLLGIAALQFVAAQVTLMTIPTNSPGLSSTCISVLNQAVTCNSSILWAGQSGRFESDDTLNGLCTAACTSALATYTRRVAGACGNERFEAGDGFAYLPQVLAEQFNEIYSTTCLKNSAGQFCNAVLRNLAGVNPNNQIPTASMASGYRCNGCLMSILQTKLEMPLTSNTLFASMLTSMTKSCSSTGYTVTTPTTASTAWSILANATSWSTTLPSIPGPTYSACVGTSYTIKSGDTCQSIATSQKVSTVALMMANNLQSKCMNFPGSGTLCIPTSGKCSVYTVKTNDTCTTVANQFSITWTQVVSWNPIVGVGCALLPAYVGFQICVSNPGGSWVNPYTVTTTTAAVTSWKYGTLKMTLTGTGSGPLQTGTGAANASISIPFANGTRMDCNLYSTGKVANIENSTASYTCNDIAAAYGVVESDLITWNPSLNQTNPCILSQNLQYCVQAQASQSTNITSSCVRYQLAGPGYSCENTMVRWGVELDQLYAWNPDIGPSCQNWLNGSNYCVEVAHYRQPGIVSTCNQFAMANQTDWGDNGCLILETQFGLSHARFVAWNPAVTTNCTGLYYHYDYCVSIPNYKPTYTTTSALPSSWSTSYSVSGLSALSSSHATTSSSVTKTTASSSVVKTTSSTKTTTSSTVKSTTTKS